MDVGELQGLLYMLGRPNNSVELWKCMDMVDQSPPYGLIDFEEFRGIHQKAKSGELRFAELSRVLTEFDELVGLLDDDDALTEEQSTAKKPRLKSPMSLFSHKKKEEGKGKGFSPSAGIARDGCPRTKKRKRERGFRRLAAAPKAAAFAKKKRKGKGVFAGFLSFFCNQIVTFQA